MNKKRVYVCEVCGEGIGSTETDDAIWDFMCRKFEKQHEHKEAKS